MTDFDPYIVVAALSAAVIVSYIFSLISVKTRIPTVMMLLVLGVVIRQVVEGLGFHYELPLTVLQFFGVLGLIVILLEAGLDLNMSREKLPLIKRATASSVFLLVLTSAAIAVIIYFVFNQNWLSAVAYAIPLGVISSTIVASSIRHLAEDKREFLTYESSLSDIFGILLFNFIAFGELSFGLIALDLVSILIALVMSVIVSVGLIFLLTKINVPIKAFLIFAFLLLIYAIGHTWELPTLLTVLIFGLIINNWRQSHRLPFHNYLKAYDVASVAESVRSVTIESAFLIRTVFFIAFGYTIDIKQLADLTVIAVGTAIVASIFLIRLLYLLLFNGGHLLPELFFSPRGLVTIVLFYSIPASLQIDGFTHGILFYVVMLSTLILMIGSIFFTPKKARSEAEPKLVNS